MRIVLLLALALLLSSAASAQTHRRHTLNLSGNTYAEFDSNIQARDVPDPGVRFSISPHGTLQANYGRLDYQTSYTPRFVGGTGGQRERWTQQFGFGGGWGVSHRTRLFVQNNYRNIEGYGFTQLATEERTPEASSVNDWQNDLTFGVSHTLAQNLNLSASAYYSVRNREDPRYYDAMYVGGNVSARYKMDDNDSFTMGVNYARNEFLAPEQPTQQSDSGSVSHVARGFVQWNHRLSRTFQFNVRVGPTVVYESQNQPLTSFPNSQIANVDLIFAQEDLGADGKPTTFSFRQPDPVDLLTTQYWAGDAANPDEVPDGPAGPRERPALAPILSSPALENCKFETLNGFQYRRLDSCDPDGASTIILPSGLFDGTNALFGRTDTALGVSDSDQLLLHDFTSVYIDLPGAALFWPSGEPICDPLPCYTWAFDVNNNAADPQNQQNVIPLDQPFGLGTLSYIGALPVARDETLFRVSINAEVDKEWERWRLSLNYLRDEQPDANGGAGVTVDRLALSTRWNASRYWTVVARFGWRYRVSNTKSKENVVIAGALRYPDGSVAYGQSREAFDAQGAGSQVIFRGSDPGNDSLSTPIGVGVVLGQDQSTVDVHTLGFMTAATRKLTQYSSVTARINYQHQISDGRFYQTFDRWSLAVAFNFTLDPIRF